VKKIRVIKNLNVKGMGRTVKHALLPFSKRKHVGELDKSFLGFYGRTESMRSARPVPSRYGARDLTNEGRDRRRFLPAVAPPGWF